MTSKATPAHPPDDNISLTQFKLMSATSSGCTDIYAYIKQFFVFTGGDVQVFSFQAKKKKNVIGLGGFFPWTSLGTGVQD